MKLLGLLTLVSIALLTPESTLAQKRRIGRQEKVVVVRRPVRKVIVRRAHVHYAGMPRWGAVVPALPKSYIKISFGINIFYYAEGVFYSRRNADYVVVRPVRGLRINGLPSGYRTLMVGPRTYYYYFGTFYVKAARADEYIVINPPIGSVVDALPEGYDIEVIDGNEYYHLDGVYYAEVDAPEFQDKIGYQVVEF